MGAIKSNVNLNTIINFDFGSATEKAVVKFQKVNGLAQDGIVGKNTWSKLLKG
jgi:peptidoglycan hydrolase-like protein with peptidoglycan-binding domain